jgi:enoyl-CoA hydratase/carnithine racemase
MEPFIYGIILWNYVMKQIDSNVQGQYFLLSMNNEGKFNPELLSEFNQALDQSLNNENVQALIITGVEKNFSQGLDLETMSKMEGHVAGNFVNECMEAVGRLLTFPIPVVAAVNGHAFGLGAMITLASDYALMREDRGFFCLPEIDIQMNLIPSMNALVAHKISGRVLRDVLLTGKRVGGKEAKDMGIVDESTNKDQLIILAKELALPMMGKNREVLQQLKLGINAKILPYHFTK